MNLLEALQQVSAQQASASQPTDYCTGTVTGVNPLEITQDVHQAPLRAEILILTECVVEKKIPILQHQHYISTLSHNHTTTDGTTSNSLTGRYISEQSLLSEGADTSVQAQDIVCEEHGEKLPIENGYIILNRKLEVGDKVLMLAVSHGQRFIVLSRIFETR